MMRDTPRSFVGTVTIRLQPPACPHEQHRIRAALAALPGVRLTGLDGQAGTVSVTADVPADRGEIVRALERAGCRVAVTGLGEGHDQGTDQD